MNTKTKGIYVAYFWKYATREQIEDMMMLSIEMIVDYIFIIGKEYYQENKDKKSIFIKKDLIPAHN